MGILQNMTVQMLRNDYKASEIFINQLKIDPDPTLKHMKVLVLGKSRIGKTTMLQKIHEGIGAALLSVSTQQQHQTPSACNTPNIKTSQHNHRENTKRRKLAKIGERQQKYVKKYFFVTQLIWLDRAPLSAYMYVETSKKNLCHT